MLNELAIAFDLMANGRRSLSTGCMAPVATGLQFDETSFTVTLENGCFLRIPLS
ncbi:hypothetical protein [Paraburkholderia sp. BL23I1N1]|uniref:hypothetical protein n=1 Tax=Paraburkholderia sp. BL23I1N1 TaxID=1938802 RepID=UPI00160340BD|nr:hypothetical protein [Paraburkholderia sp. BL23I1N1]